MQINILSVLNIFGLLKHETTHWNIQFKNSPQEVILDTLSITSQKIMVE